MPRFSPSNVSVQGNQLDAYGQVEAVLVISNGVCGFNDNQCVLQRPHEQGLKELSAAVDEFVATNPSFGHP